MHWDWAPSRTGTGPHSALARGTGRGEARPFPGFPQRPCPLARGRGGAGFGITPARSSAPVPPPPPTFSPSPAPAGGLGLPPTGPRPAHRRRLLQGHAGSSRRRRHRRPRPRRPRHHRRSRRRCCHGRARLRRTMRRSRAAQRLSPSLSGWTSTRAPTVPLCQSLLRRCPGGLAAAASLRNPWKIQGFQVTVLHSF